MPEGLLANLPALRRVFRPRMRLRWGMGSPTMLVRQSWPLQETCMPLLLLSLCFRLLLP